MLICSLSTLELEKPPVKTVGGYWWSSGFD